MDVPAKSVGKQEGAVGKALPHDSAHLHVTGRAAYTDDIPEPRDLLHLAVGMSQKPHARITNIDLSNVAGADGVVDVCVAADIAGDNNYGPIVADDPVFAEQLVEYVGQPVFAVAATTVDGARKAARKACIEYAELEAILDPLTAVEKRSFVLPSETMVRGDPGKALENSPHRVARRVLLGGQDQFYLEGHIAMAIPQDDGGLLVYSSTQHPDEVQSMVAHATLRSAKDIVVICRRMGGAFGGKESQAATDRLYRSATRWRTRPGRPCKLRLDRDDDMIMTGKRHDFVIDYDVGFDDTGRILEGIDFDVSVALRHVGRSLGAGKRPRDVSLRQCLFPENVSYRIAPLQDEYRIEVRRFVVSGDRRACSPSNMSSMILRGALGKDPLDVRRSQFLWRQGERDVTHYGQQVVDDNIIDDII